MDDPYGLWASLSKGHLEFHYLIFL